jgi:hypothetical protein
VGKVSFGSQCQKFLRFCWREDEYNLENLNIRTNLGIPLNGELGFVPATFGGVAANVLRGKELDKFKPQVANLTIKIEEHHPLSSRFEQW